MKTRKSMRELKQLKGLKTFFDRRLIEALGHPVREHALAVFNERIASGKDIADELGTDVSAFYHHIEQLEKLDCIERVASRRRRGATEHFFRAKRTVFFDDEKWNALPESIKNDLSVAQVQGLIDDFTSALRTGTLNRRHDRHISWIPSEVDAQGWREVQSLLAETLGRLTQILSEARRRSTEQGRRGQPITVALLAFERPADSQSTSETAARP